MGKIKNLVKQLLIIFVKNPMLGKIKTRLAADVGDDRALEIYKRLLSKTHQVTKSGEFSKWVFYSDWLDKNDIWQDGYEKKLQKGTDLGERISNAFQSGFESGYNHICIIGSDCFDLEGDSLSNAFDNLNTHDFVIGPANDGGYYLLGMNSYYPELFQNKDWSTDKVLPQTISGIKSVSKTFHLLTELSDIDTLEDLQKFPELNF